MNRRLKHLLRQISTSSHSQHPEEHLSTVTQAKEAEAGPAIDPKQSEQTFFKRASRGRRV